MDKQSGSVSTLWNNTTRAINSAAVSLKESSLRQLGKLAAVSQHLDVPLEKANDFYQNHK